ncbi:vasopressin V2 receptor-like [Oenanthe melanoleuca]|uniref:vasopressin V2 receptor-like n=1 Tax=Oenanthe melanoleuca TaxID=2939378 RepID=UPI0024C1544D|nr:vasopressin V2 receptor-like [Oenanthe melanoleuca]
MEATPPGTPPPPRDAALALAEVAVLALLLLLAVAGNALVLLALRSPRRWPRWPGPPPARPARPLRRYLRHLSLADLAAAAGQVLPQLLWDLTDRFRGPDPLCRLTKYLQGVAMFASAYVAVAMAWDRHRAICHPLEGSWATTEGSWATMGGAGAMTARSVATTGGSQATPAVSGATRRGSWATPAGSGATTQGSWATMGGSVASPGWCQVAARWARSGLRWIRSGLRWARSALAGARRRWDALATAWALALLFGLPQVGIFGQREVAPGESDCWATFAQPWGARAYVTWVALAVLVAPALLLATLQVAVTRALRGSRGVPGGPGGLARARARSHRMAAVVLGVFVLCWSPFFCAQLWAVWDPRAPREGPAFTILMLLASLTSCTNPWISAAFSATLARAMARVLCPCRHQRGVTE